MFRKLHLIVALLCCAFISANAQEGKTTALVKGRLQNKVTNEFASEVQVTIPYLKLMTITNGSGNFTFSQVPFGTYTIVVGSGMVKYDTLKIVVTKELVDLGTLEITMNEAAAASAQPFQIPTVALEDNDLSSDVDASSSQSANISGLLTASRDPFQNAAAFTFSTYRFQVRGYDRNQQQVFINGAPMNDIETGDAYWSQWGGLNDVFRSRSSAYGLQPSEYAFGGMNGSVYFDASAANQRKQTRVSYSLTNRQYTNRIMLTHSSGLLKSGWAYSVSASKRWGQEGYVEGTFYDGYSYFAAVTKKIGTKHEINLSAFGAPTKRGKMSPSYQEAYNLTSNYYNPNWGYQDGKKRNARVANIFQPTFILNYEFAPSDKTRWSTTASYQFGKNANSLLDWYNAPDPRPDYYKYLPNYYIYDEQPNLLASEQNRQEFINNPQLKWDELYQANYLNRTPIPNADGTLSKDTGRRSLYVLGNDIDDVKKWTFNTNLQTVLNEHITLYTGISFISQRTESYRQLLDLLGGDYYLNLNSFAERNFAGTTVFNQNDADNPFKVIKEGDKYYYDYILRFQKAWWWGQATFTSNKFDFFLAANYGFNSFQREGLYRNGLFAEGNKSFGKGEKQNFAIYGAKGGITYKINGRNYLFVNAGLTADAPTVDNTYFSARTRNATVIDPTTQKSYSIEGGYLLRAPKANARVVGYATDIKDRVELQRFYNAQGASANNMIDYVLQGVNVRFTGLELALEYKLTSSLAVTGVAAMGQAFYTNNPRVSIYKENSTDTARYVDSVYIKNYYLGVGPQSVYTIGFNYRSKNYWYLSGNVNYLDRNYIDVAAPRRTVSTVELMQPGSEQWHTVLDQEKFKSAFTVDLFVGFSLMPNKYNKKIPRRVLINFNIGVNNLLNSTDIRTGGFENARFDPSGFVNKYGSKYFYSYGRNFFANLAFKF